MGYTEEQVLGQAVRKRLVRMVRDHAGAFPGEDLVDIHSMDAFLGSGMARKAPNWYFFSGTPMPEGEREPSNWEHKPMELPELPFPDQSIAAVFGAFLEAAFQGWSPELADELARVMVPKGRVLFLVRAPGARTPGVERGLPEGIPDLLEAAGFGRAQERRLSHLLDGSEVHLIEATFPWHKGED